MNAAFSNVTTITLQQMKKIVSMAKKAANKIYRGWCRLQVFVERGMPTSPVSRDVATCSHCGHVFCGNYCPRCGQHRAAGKGKPRLFKTFREAYPQLSGNFIRTIINLALRPGYMIRDYFRGHRVLYQNPVSAFLIAVSIAALCSGTFGRIAHDGQQKEEPTVIGHLGKLVDEEISKKASKDKDVRKAYDRWSTSRQLDNHRHTAAVLSVVKEKLASNTSFTLFALFPIFGSISCFVFRKRTFDGRRLTLMEHYVIFAYLYALFTFIDFSEFIPLFYIAWTYRGIYRLSWFKSIGYAVLVFGMTIISLLILICLIIALMLAPVVYYYNVAAL